MARREFTRDVKAEIVKRASAGGEIACEGCGLVLTGKKFHIDHTKPDAMEVDKSRKLTADDGKLLGVDCCHGPKTRNVDIPMIAKAKRTEAKHLGIDRQKPKISSKGFDRKERHSKPALPPRPLYEARG